ncbi:MAG: hypothetical protein LH702_29055 [Phormidesmis sp. CAN_BIN44]|nr:hypothetical protein [Phormidesmis sp. CAN_BIN44]
MRRAARTDSNQTEIVAILRSLGCSVQPLHTVGSGCPDLLIGIDGQNLLLEVKDGSKPPSARRLTSDQQVWHTNWGGQAAIVQSLEDAIAIVSQLKSKHHAIELLPAFGK